MGVRAMGVGDFTERIEEDQRRNDWRYDEDQERRQQEARAQLVRQVKDSATAFAAPYGITVETLHSHLSVFGSVPEFCPIRKLWFIESKRADFRRLALELVISTP